MSRRPAPARSAATAFPYVRWLLAGAALSVLVVVVSPPLQRKLVSRVYRTYRHYLHPPNGSANLRTPALTGYPVRGVDVSAHQGEIDWRRVGREKGVKFAFIKATEGRSWLDPYFDQNWDAARAAGLRCGAYHFYRPNRDARQQADFFVNQVTLAAGNLPPVLDVEKTDGRSAEEIRRGLRIWLRLVGKRYGVKPILYTNHKFYLTYLHGHFDDYPLWVANYQVSAPRLNAERWIIWQHSDEVLVPGIRGYVDGNVFAGSVEDLNELLLK